MDRPAGLPSQIWTAPLHPRAIHVPASTSPTSPETLAWSTVSTTADNGTACPPALHRVPRLAGSNTDSKQATLSMIYRLLFRGPGRTETISPESENTTLASRHRVRVQTRKAIRLVTAFPRRTRNHVATLISPMRLNFMRPLGLRTDASSTTGQITPLGSCARELGMAA